MQLGLGIGFAIVFVLFSDIVDFQYIFLSTEEINSLGKYKSGKIQFRESGGKNGSFRAKGMCIIV